jgi:NAD(P)-dependent dehydrogenase (short-subunit alcohol dehydrogenase family)
VTGRLAGRTAVVVGGASGSGRATALLLAAEGARVVIADLDATGATATAAAIRADGGRATAIAVDIADESSVAHLASCLEAVAPLDVLYNSAAITDPAHQRADGPAAEVDLAIWNRTLAVDLTGVMLTCRALLPLMRSPGGSIVNVTSNAGLAGNDTLTAYGVAKAALHQLTRAIASTYGHLGIRCNALSPAFIASESFRANVPAEVAATMAGACLLGRFGTVDDVARAALFLCSDASAFVTGEVLRVDGGALGHLAGASTVPASGQAA